MYCILNFPTCPIGVGQVEEKSTFRALFYVKQLPTVLCLLWKFMQSTMVTCCCCFNVQNDCFYLVFTYCQHLDHTSSSNCLECLIVIQPQRLREQSFPMPCSDVHHMVSKSKTTYITIIIKWLFKLWIWILSISQNQTEWSENVFGLWVKIILSHVPCSSDFAETHLF